LAIIAIVVLVFLILIFTGGIGKFVSNTNQIGPSSNQTNNAQCSEYATAINTQMGTSTDPNAQLQMLANSQYVSSGCSTYFQYTFTLYNGSEVICGLGQNVCINLNNGGSNNNNNNNNGGSGGSGGSSCTPPNGIPGCQLQ